MSPGTRPFELMPSGTFGQAGVVVMSGTIDITFAAGASTRPPVLPGAKLALVVVSMSRCQRVRLPLALLKNQRLTGFAL